MIKIFTTQLVGKLKSLQEQEDTLEDCARAIAQALVGEGTIYVHGFKEMEAVLSEVRFGQETNAKYQPLYHDGEPAEWSNVDRILLFTRFSNDEEAIELAESLQNKGAVVIACSANVEASAKSLTELADFHIDTNLLGPLVPTEDGTRIGFPAAMLALFCYHCLSLMADEIVAEQ